MAWGEDGVTQKSITYKFADYGNCLSNFWQF